MRVIVVIAILFIRRSTCGHGGGMHHRARLDPPVLGDQPSRHSSRRTSSFTRRRQTANRSPSSISMERSFAPHGGCEGLKSASIAARPKEDLPTRELDYEAPGASRSNGASGRIKIRRHDGVAWFSPRRSTGSCRCRISTKNSSA